MKSVVFACSILVAGATLAAAEDADADTPTAPPSDESISRIRYDKNDQIVSFPAFGKVKFREGKEGEK